MRVRSATTGSIVAPVVLVACFLLVASRTLGIERGDDLLWYMQPASAVMPSSFFLNHYWSPLYCFWLQVLAVVCPNPVWRYFVSWGVMAMIALPSLLVFLVQLLPRGLAEPPLATTVGVGVATMVLFQIGLPSLRHEYPSRAQMYLRQAECERAVDLAAPQSNRVAFDSEGVQDILLGGQRSLMVPATLLQWSEFKRWAGQTQPAWIAEDQSLPSTYGVSDAEFESFMLATLGYTAHACNAQAHMTVYTP
jgi:hypothetical protein